MIMMFRFMWTDIHFWRQTVCELYLLVLTSDAYSLNSLFWLSLSPSPLSAMQNTYNFLSTLKKRRKLVERHFVIFKSLNYRLSYSFVEEKEIIYNSTSVVISCIYNIIWYSCMCGLYITALAALNAVHAISIIIVILDVTR